MKLGDTGGDVTAWQQTLNKVGFDLAIDGVFGATTLADTIDYQKELGVVADGVVGPQTIAMHNARHPEAPYALTRELPEQTVTGTSPSRWMLYAGVGVIAFLVFKGMQRES